MNLPASDTAHVLVVDDDRRLRELLKRYLAENGFIVTVAASAAEARAQMASFDVDLVVLDVMMPEEDGISLTRSIRTSQNVPILLLTARGSPGDRIKGLEAGADDYMAKPFEPRELVLRMHAILRRTPRPLVSDTLQLGPLVFHTDREELLDNGQSVRLTQAEIMLLKTLAANPGRTMSREMLVVRTGIDGGERTVDVQVTRLRRKIEADPRDPRYLLTIRGEGYMLRPGP